MARPEASLLTTADRAVVDHVSATVEHLLGPSLVGIYLCGSAADGGLHRDSDVDLLVMARDPLTDDERRALLTDLLRVSGRRATHGPARPVELTVLLLEDVMPWRYPPRLELHYGEWLRDAVLAGDPLRPLVEPDVAVLLTQARACARPLAGPPAQEVLPLVPPGDLRRAIVDSLPPLLTTLRGDERNVLLTLARMCVTLETGAIVPKDVAAARVLLRLQGPLRELLAEARAGYRGELDDDWTGRDAEVDRLARQLAATIHH